MKDDLYPKIQQALEHLDPRRLTQLFCEDLLWSRPRGLFPLSLQVGAPVGREIQLHPIAKAGDVPVFWTPWDQEELPGITARRAVYQKLTQNYPEHLMCYVTKDLKRVAFVWARLLGDKKTEFRTLPYEVGSPARTTIERLAELAFRWEELETGEPPITHVTDKLNAAFSVEAVTKQFFDDYKRVFEALQRRLLDELPSTEKDSASAKTWAHDYALQLLNRLMFLYFIQRKGWLGKNPRFLRHFWESYKRSGQPRDSFFSQWLKVLFFEAFNNKFHGGHRHFPEGIREALQLAPYLNGGLFSENSLDRAHSVNLPDAFFEQIFDAFNGSTPGFLERYNFTIAESTPFDVEVAVDPEMIGKVYESLVNITFEELTEEDLRGQAGIFYTPRVEIDLMCRLALVDALSNRLGAEFRTLLYDVVFATDPDEKESADAALTAHNLWSRCNDILRSLTICDPACGSGSFLVGMLLVLDDLYARANVQLGIEETPYERRRRIIGEQLYGVDVMDWAVHVAELRLWLQLVVETDLKPAELKFRPLLPNLSFKVRQGDSLVQEIAGINLGRHRQHLRHRQHQEIPASLKRKITQLKGRKLRFYQGETGIQEEALKQEEFLLFREILQHKIPSLQDQIAALDQQIATLHAQTELPGMETDSNSRAPTARETELRAQLEGKQDDLARFQDALNALKTVQDVPFVWDIAFVEIFEGDSKGFDVVIGNPPYVRQESIAPPLEREDDYTPDQWRQRKAAYKEKLQRSVAAAWPRFFQYKPGSNRFRKLDGRSDLYIYFYFHALSLLNSQGSFCFITSNSWLDVGYGAELQEFLLRHSHVKLVLDNEAKRSFARADVNTVIVLLAPPDDHREDGLSKTARFVLFKKPFKEVARAEVFKAIEAVTERQSTPDYRITARLQRELLEEGLESETDEESPTPQKRKSHGPLIKTARYIGNKWGGRYLRAPDIFFTILEKGKGKLQLLRWLCQVEGYIHDNNTGSQYPEAYFLRSVKNIDTIMLRRDSPGVVRYGVRAEGNSRLVAPILFPRTLGNRHVVVWNREDVLAKEFYKIIPRQGVSALVVAAELNSTFCILQRELLGLANLGSGGLKFSADDIGMFLITGAIEEENISEVFEKMSRRKIQDIHDEIRQPDRRALDEVVFEVLGLTAGEREAVYKAVVNLVRARLEKARSV